MNEYGASSLDAIDIAFVDDVLCYRTPITNYHQHVLPMKPWFTGNSTQLSFYLYSWSEWMPIRRIVTKPTSENVAQVPVEDKFVLDLHDQGHYLARSGNDSYPIGCNKNKAVDIINMLNRAGRPNLKMSGGTLYVCFNNHDRSDECQYELVLVNAYS